jgi:phosphoglycerate dehydrogenase-like enzyme
MISTREFEKMKRVIIIVNTARGGVMDEEALVKAIDSGHVLSAGLDVYQNEPNIHPALVSNPHVCLLPHMGTTTFEVCTSSNTLRPRMLMHQLSMQTKTKMEEWNIASVRSALERGKLNNVVLEQEHLV